MGRVGKPHWCVLVMTSDYGIANVSSHGNWTIWELANDWAEKVNDAGIEGVVAYTTRRRDATLKAVK